MKGVVYYKLLKPNETIIAERYQQQLIDLNCVFVECFEPEMFNK